MKFLPVFILPMAVVACIIAAASGEMFWAAFHGAVASVYTFLVARLLIGWSRGE